MGIQINGQTDTISATDGSFTISGASGNLTGDLTGNVTGNLTGNVNSTGITTFTDLRVGTAVTANSIGVQVGAGKSIRLYGATSGYADIIAAAGSASTTFTLPANGGTNGQYLQTSGSGALSWATVTSGMTASGPAFFANAAGSQTLTHNTNTKLTFATPTFDTNSSFSTGNSRFTPNVHGIYLIRAQCTFVNTGGDAVEKDMSIVKNGITIIWGDLGGTNSHYGGYTTVHVAGLAEANGSSDYFEVYAYQYDSDSETFSINTGRSYFTAVLVREL